MAMKLASSRVQVRDFQGAISILQVPVAAGNADATLMLASILFEISKNDEGLRGVEEFLTRLIDQAFDVGLTEKSFFLRSHYLLGMVLIDPRRAVMDKDRAKASFTTVAESGDPDAYFQLAQLERLYPEDHMNQGIIERHYRAAAQGGHIGAKFELACLLYKSGGEAIKEAKQRMKEALEAGFPAAIDFAADHIHLSF